MRLCRLYILQPDASLPGIGLLRFPAEGSNGSLLTFVPGAVGFIGHYRPMLKC